MTPVFFRSPAELRGWLAAHHARAAELWIGFHKKGSGRTGITYPEALDQALCFGWIDGVRRSLGDDTWTIRFTPRRAKSYWSAVNLRRARALKAEGLMKPSGLAALEARPAPKPGRYSYEHRPERMPPALERRLRASRKAAAFFEAQPPWYRRTARWWIVSAAREETRVKRLDVLIADSARGLWIAGLRDKQPRAKTAPRKPRGARARR